MTNQGLQYQCSCSKVHAFPAFLPYKTMRLKQQAMQGCVRRLSSIWRTDCQKRWKWDNFDNKLPRNIRWEPGIHRVKLHSTAPEAFPPFCTATVSGFLLTFPILLWSLCFQNRPSSSLSLYCAWVLLISIQNTSVSLTPLQIPNHFLRSFLVEEPQVGVSVFGHTALPPHAASLCLYCIGCMASHSIGVEGTQLLESQCQGLNLMCVIWYYEDSGMNIRIKWLTIWNS